RLPGEQVVDRRIAVAAPVLRVARRVAPQEQIGVVAGLDGRADDQLEAPGIPPIREPGRGLERPVIGLDTDLPPLLDRKDREVLIRQLHVAVLQDQLEAVGVTRFGEQLLGLSSLLLLVPPEPRKLPEL